MQVMIVPPGDAVPGATAFYLVRACAMEFPVPKITNDFGNTDINYVYLMQVGRDAGYRGSWPLPPDWMQIQGQTLMNTGATSDDGSFWGETIVQATAGALVEVTPTIMRFHLYPDATFNVQASEINLQLAVDANRDGQLSFTGPDQTTASRPYRFWVNNDFDGYDSAIEDYDDLNPSTGSDVNDLAIGCTRDLEDYTRLWINVKGLITELQNGSLLLALEWKDAVDDPRLQFFQAAEPDGGALYLTNSAVAAQQVSGYGTHLIEWAHRNVLTQYNPFVFPPDFWANLSDEQPVAHLLFDAVGRGSGRLVISIYKNDGVTKLVESSPLYLKLQDVKEMYERWTVGESGAPVTTASPVTSPYPCDTTIPADNNYILFVHGWNLAPWERDAYAETAFKRLYWQGYPGHFGAFQWPTESGFSGIISAITDAHNYDNSEFNAWNSGLGLKNLLTALNNSFSGHVYLMAHSMGNVVAGEALKLAGSNQMVNTYVAMQAAVPAHCYDPITDFRTIKLLLDSGTPDRYANYPTNNGPCYFDGIAGAGSFINFFNPVDWALESDHWQLDQDLKPDLSYSYDGTNFYSGSYLLTLPSDTYRIFANCIEARCFALGAQANVGGKFATAKQVNLSQSPFNFGSQHKDHSGEFNSDNMNRSQFWDEALNQMKLK